MRSHNSVFRFCFRSITSHCRNRHNSTADCDCKAKLNKTTSKNAPREHIPLTTAEESCHSPCVVCVAVNLQNLALLCMYHCVKFCHSMANDMGACWSWKICHEVENSRYIMKFYQIYNGCIKLKKKTTILHSNTVYIYVLCHNCYCFHTI